MLRVKQTLSIKKQDVAAVVKNYSYLTLAAYRSLKTKKKILENNKFFN